MTATLPLVDRRISFCTTDDGVRIAYSSTGEGPPLIMCPFFVEAFSLADQLPEYRDLAQGLGRGRQLVRFDMRGTGLSDRAVADFSTEALALDIRAIARALRLRRFALFGAGLSGPRAVSYAAAHPRALSHLILYSTFTQPEAVMAPGAARGFAELARSSWDIAAQALVDLSGRERTSQLNVRGAALIRESADGDVVAGIIEATLASGDVRGLLPRVRVPSLIIQATDTRLFREEFGHELARSLPRAQLRLLQGVPNWLDPGAGAAVSRLVDEFMGAPAATDLAPPAAGGPPSTAAFRAILFTDLVSHTAAMQRLGDAHGRALLREHERITRQALAAHSGTELKTGGDSFMASFMSATSAIECAIAIQRAIAEWNVDPDHESMQVRIGVNAGEPVAEEGDLFGASVILAARVKDQAGGGEILIPGPVRHLLAGKDFSFADRGEFVPRGFDDAVRLYEVRWQA